MLVMVPYFDDPSLGLVQLLFSLAYPVGDVLLLALAARLATTPGRRTAAFRLLIANLAVTMAADTLVSVLTLSGATAAVTDGMYLGAYLLLGGAGLHPRWPGCPSRPGAGRPASGGGGCWPMGAAALVAPVLLVLQRLQRAELQVGTVAGAGDRVDQCIRDDGVGFQPQFTSALIRDGHFGLVAMQERVEMADGHFQVDTHPGAGVRVRAIFRVPPAA